MYDNNSVLNDKIGIMRNSEIKWCPQIFEVYRNIQQGMTIVQSCLLIISQYQPISLRYFWLNIERPIWSWLMIGDFPYIFVLTLIITLTTVIRFDILVSMIFSQMITELSDTTEVYSQLRYLTYCTLNKRSLIVICHKIHKNSEISMRKKSIEHYRYLRYARDKVLGQNLKMFRVAFPC